MGQSFLQLDADLIISTVETLSRRIRERFPKAGLAKVCDQLLAISRQAQVRAAGIARPIWSVRLGAVAFVVAIATMFAVTYVKLNPRDSQISTAEFVQVLEAGFNATVLIGAALIFFFTLDTRIKRRRCLEAIHELRSIAHIIDMHQLTKDPERLLSPGSDTASSPKRTMTGFELNRYLDYCSEMLALVGKIAALYVQDFADADAVAAVNDLEDLTASLARKVWQKIMVLNEIPLDRSGAPPKYSDTTMYIPASEIPGSPGPTPPSGATTGPPPATTLGAALRAKESS